MHECLRSFSAHLHQQGSLQLQDIEYCNKQLWKGRFVPFEGAFWVGVKRETARTKPRILRDPFALKKSPKTQFVGSSEKPWLLSAPLLILTHFWWFNRENPSVGKKSSSPKIPWQNAPKKRHTMYPEKKRKPKKKKPREFREKARQATATPFRFSAKT